MINREETIRNYLKTLTVEEIADSTYLFGDDFDNDSIESILDSILLLYNNVKQLQQMVDNNFKSSDGIKRLVPSDRDTQSVVIENLFRKYSVLNKILANSSVLEATKERLAFKIQEEKGANLK